MQTFQNLHTHGAQALYETMFCEMNGGIPPLGHVGCVSKQPAEYAIEIYDLKYMSQRQLNYLSFLWLGCNILTYERSADPIQAHSIQWP